MKITGPDFIRATCYENLTETPPQFAGEPQPPLELPVDPQAVVIPLPAPSDLHMPEISLRQALEHRKTHRIYTRQPLNLDELSYLLWLTQGVKLATYGANARTQRIVPSAGARHAFETYLLINNVEGLEPGLYRFWASRHALVQVRTSPNLKTQFTHACRDQKQVDQSAVTFIWVAVSERMTWRYVERGYRYLLLDAGHVCQNLYLAAEAIGCGVCAIAAYDDALLNQALGVDGEQQWAIYAGSVGKLKVP